MDIRVKLDEPVGPRAPAVPAAPALAVALPAERDPSAVYLARLAPGSRRTMRGALETIAALVSGGRATAETLDWSRLRYQHTAAIRAVVADRYAPAGANKFLSALRGVLREAWRLGYMGAEDFHRAADLETVRGETLPPGRALSPGELRALFSLCASDRCRPRGARDAALLAVLYGAGLRRAEIVALELADYQPDAGELKVRGKGQRERLAYLPAGASAALAAWLAERGPEPGPLFCRVNKSGRLELAGLSTQALYTILRRLGKAADVASFSPHDLRRTFVSNLLEAGADIAAVQRLAGHANLQTTARYDRRGEHAKRKAIELLHVPYVAERPRSDPA